MDTIQVILLFSFLIILCQIQEHLIAVFIEYEMILTALDLTYLM